MHLNNEAVTGELYASEWFISLFTYTFDVADVGRIWDLFLLGGWKQLLRVALGVLAQAEDRLQSMSFEAIVQAVKHRPCTLLCGDIDEVDTGPRRVRWSWALVADTWVSRAQVLRRAAQFKVTNALLAALEVQFWREYDDDASS